MEPTARPAPGRSTRAQLIAIGDELLSGDTVNTNAAFVGQRCRAVGLPLHAVRTVRDRIEEIVAAIASAAGACEVCLVCGGLGPTTDDLTTVAVAQAVGVPVDANAEAQARLIAKFKSFGLKMPASNLKQADFPRGAEILPNPIGSAEGFCLKLGTCLVFVMPGVPRELELMMVQEVVPRMQARFDLQPVLRRVYGVLGRGESGLAESIAPAIAAARASSPGLAAMFVHYRASTPQVWIALEAVPNEQGVRASADELRGFDNAFVTALGPALFGIGDAPLAVRVVAALKQHDLRICVAESCTAGGIGKLLATVPGASAVFDGGVIAYDNRVKIALLGVPAQVIEQHGAVSEATACAMAEGARDALGSDLGVAISGIAGPGGGSPEKPVGTVHIAVSDAAGILHKKLHLRGKRATVQHASELWALKLVWDRLRNRGLAQLEEITL